MKNGLDLSIHTFAIPVAVSLRCHSARFLGEKEPSLCSKPCLTKSHLIRQKELKKSFVLHGNVVYRLVDSQYREVNQLQRMGIKEFIIPTSPLFNSQNIDEINEVIATLSRGA